MATEEIVDRVSEPVTIETLASDFRDLGLEAGDVVIVHSSLSSIGWVSGGAQAVVDALQQVLTESGTLVMPTHTPQNSDPSDWHNPPVPESWYERIEESRPPYRPRVTPTQGVGAVPECFRNYPGTHRSAHPLFSFAAWGADARAVVADHAYEYSLGRSSPLRAVYDREGKVLLLGVGHAVNTSLHLAEYRADLDHELQTRTAPVLEDGERVLVECEDIVQDTDDFADVGAAFESEADMSVGTVGAAESRLLEQRPLVDFAVEWFEANR